MTGVIYARYSSDNQREESIEGQIMNDVAIEKSVTMMLTMQDQENTTIPVLEKQLRDVNKAISNLIRAIERGIFNRATKDRMDELEAARVELETQLACEKLAKPKITREQVTFWLMRFRVMDFTQKEHRQQLIDNFVNSVYLYDPVPAARRNRRGCRTA